MKTQWDFSDWAKLEEFETNRLKITADTDAFVQKWKGRTDYLENAEVLKESIYDYSEYIKNNYFAREEGYYYWLNQELDQTDLSIRAKYNSIIEFIQNEDNKITFFVLSLGKIPKEKQEYFLLSEALSEYKCFLSEIFLGSKYMLSEKEEAIMNLKSTAAHSMWVRMTASLLSKETSEIDGEEKTYSELLSIMKNGDKKHRDNAKEKFEEILEKYSNMAEAEFNAVLEDHKINDMLRGFKRSDEARLLNDSVDTKFVDILRDSVATGFPISKKFYELKSKLLNQGKIGYHERSAEYGKISKKFNWEESYNLIKKVFLQLDQEFFEIFEKFVNDGRVDVNPRKGKNSGAFCVKTGVKLPTYILLNHTNNLNDVTTIAHEVGHGINNEMIRKNQDVLYFDTPVSTAEVASTFMEDFVLIELLKTATDSERLTILMKKLDDDISSIMRQIACYNFELEAHSKYREVGYLSKSTIGKIFKKHMESYMGDAVDLSTVDNWWIYWSHIRNYFYVYSYASGLMISKSLQNKVKENPEFILKVKKFLAAGTSKTPYDIFKEMGIDIYKKDFWKSGIKEIENLYNEVEELAKKLGKI